MLQAGAAGTRGFMIGANADEMTLFTLTLSIPDAAAYEALVRSQAGDYVADYLLQIWPASEFATPLAAYRRFAADIGFVCPTFASAKAVSDGGGSAYAYHFAYAPNPASTLGSFHGLELFYVFGQYATRLPALGIAPDSGDADLSVAMQEAWTSYARTGAPSTTPAWPAFAPAPSGYAADGSALVFERHAESRESPRELRRARGRASRRTLRRARSRRPAPERRRRQPHQRRRQLRLHRELRSSGQRGRRGRRLRRHRRRVPVRRRDGRRRRGLRRSRRAAPGARGARVAHARGSRQVQRRGRHSRLRRGRRSGARAPSRSARSAARAGLRRRESELERTKVLGARI